MNKIKNIVGLMLLVVLLQACNKELPEIPNSDSPVFYAVGTIDNQQVEIDAGDNQYMMESNTWDWNGVSVFRGELSNSTNSFMIDLFNGNILRNSTQDDLLQMLQFACAYLPANVGSISLNQLVNSNGIDNCNWEMNGMESDSITFQAPGIYTLQFHVYGTGETITNKVIVGYHTQSLFKLSVDFETELVFASINENLSSIESVEWVYGSQSYTTTTPEVVFSQEFGTKALVAKVKFINGIERTRTILVGQNEFPNVEDYVYLIESANQHVFDYKTELKIRLGSETYTTIQSSQTSEYPVQIIEKSAYVDPITKQQALKLKLIITAKMKKMSSGEIVDADFEATIALPFVN